jgi:serine/threonine protein kinase
LRGEVIKEGKNVRIIKAKNDEGDPSLIKQISHSTLSHHQKLRLYRKARISQTLAHPYTIYTHDVSLNQTHITIVQEYCFRGTLAGILRE